MEKVGLTIDEVMWRVFVYVVWFFEGTFVQPDQKNFVEMADDSDPCGERKGYMIYDQFVRFENAKGHKFTGGFGKKCNNYPGEVFSSDFLLIKLGKNFDGKEAETIKDSEYFRNSLFVTLKSGSFSVGPRFDLNDSLFSRSIMSEYIVRNMKVDPDHLTLSCNSIVIESFLYNEKFVDYLAQIAINYIQN